MKNEQYVGLWSPKQKAFHVEPVKKMLETNRMAFLQQTALDYITIAIGSKDDVDDFIDRLRKLRDSKNDLL